MSKNLVLKGLSFVRKGQGGKPSSVDTSGKASEGAVSFVASSGGKEGSKTKLKREPHLPKGGSVNHGRISKPAKAKRSSGEKLQKEVAKRHELKRMCIPIPEESVRDKNMEFYGLQQRRSKKVLKNISQYVEENKSVVSRKRTSGPLLPPRVRRGKDSKAERKARREMQFSVLRISELGGSIV